MNVFVSWSGPTSRRLAEILRDWLPHVLQEVAVFVSSQDIDKGERWAASIADSLNEHEFGFLVLTKQNLTAPWIMFEAGALSKTVKSRLIPILCNVDRLDLAGSPIQQFQNILIDRDDVFGALKVINTRLSNPLPDGRLTSSFEKWWPDLETAYRSIEFKHTADTGAVLSQDELVGPRLDRIERAVESVLASIDQIKRSSVAQKGPAQTDPMINHPMRVRAEKRRMIASLQFLLAKGDNTQEQSRTIAEAIASLSAQVLPD